MALRKYTIAEFRKNVREAINNIDAGGQTFITRHGVRYELIKAPVQGGKQQLKEHNQKVTPVTAPGYKNVGVKEDGTLVPLKPSDVFIAPPTPQPFPKNGDSGAQIENADDLTDAFGPLPPEKNIASADALNKVKTNADALIEWESNGIAAPTNTLHIARGLMRNQLAGIDIETQDPEEVELGATLAASIDEITVELKRRGSE